MDISDIHGAKAFSKMSGVKVRMGKKPRDANLNVKDINEYMRFETKRTTNPLQPRYQIQNNEGDVINYGHIGGSNPKRLHPLDVNKQITNLTSLDIVGAQSNTIPERFLRTEVSFSWESYFSSSDDHTARIRERMTFQVPKRALWCTV
jgi:hypothetical protein